MKAPTPTQLAEADAEHTLAQIARFERDLVVQAGAGTGKTHALVTLYLHLIGGLTASGERSPPARIVVITFTDKAAAELKQRIRDRLTPLATGQLSEADAPYATVERSVWQAALAQVGRAPIGTFHGFAGTLLRQHAARALLPPDYRQLDESEARRLNDEAAERAIFQALDDPDPEFVDAVERLINGLGFAGSGRTTGLVGLLTNLSKRRDDEGRGAEELDDAYGDEVITVEIESAERQWRHALDELRPLVRTFTAKTQERAAALLPHREPDPTRFDELFALLKRWSGDVAKAHKDALEAGLDRLAAALRSQRAQPSARALTRLIDSTQRNYRAAKERRGALDFSDLLVKARDLLADPSLRDEAQARFDAVLVDEFQDTNEVQAELVEALAGPPRAFGRRFVVGDRKQSIYEFRGADVGVFTRVSRSLVEAGAAQLVLRSSRRSRPELVAFLNDFFTVVMQPRAPSSGADTVAHADWQLRFAPESDALLPVKAPLTGAGARLLLCTGDKEQTAAIARRREARAIAAQMRALQKEGRRFGDMAMLLRSYTPLGVYTDALRLANVPHYIVRGRGLYATQEARDLLSLATLLVDPEDRGALIAVLRSPLVTLSDESLLRLRLLRRLALRQLARPDALATLPSDEADRLTRFCAVVESLRPRVVLDTAEACLRTAVETLEVAGVLAATLKGRERVANLERLLEHAARFAERGTLPAFVVWLRGKMARGDEEEQAQLYDESDDVVRVMTVHQAKGLQFPVVFIPDCGSPGQNDQGNVRYAPSLGLGVRARPATPLDKWSNTLPFQRVVEHNRARREAESLRLLYVAATRAEDLVIFSGERKHGWRKEIEHWRTQSAQPELLTLVDDHTLPTPRPARPEQLSLLSPSSEAAAWVERAYAPPPITPRILTVAVTALAEAEEQTASRHFGNAGEPDADELDPLARGSLAHRLLERCRFGEPATIDQQLHAAGYPPSDPAVAEIRADVLRFFSSPFGRALAGRPLRRELPFLLSLPLHTTTLHVRGQIDLAVFDDDGITLIDYKDSRSRGQPTAAQELQLQAYALAAHRLYPRAPAIRAALVFLKDGEPAPRYLELPPPAELAAHLSRAGQALLTVLSTTWR